jgi:hypothetical protein
VCGNDCVNSLFTLAVDSCHCGRTKNTAFVCCEECAKRKGICEACGVDYVEPKVEDYSDPEDKSLSWRQLLKELKEMDEDGVDLSGTVCISDGGDTFGQELIKDKRGNFYIKGF